MIRLGVNIDHVATLRQARMGREPIPLEAAFVCEKAGAHGITVHLREDRRHIQDEDVISLKKNSLLPLNLEMALSDDIIKFAQNIKPHSVCIVPEKREELTTEGGLDAVKNGTKLKNTVRDLKKNGIGVSIFINPENDQVLACTESGADFIELNTGEYSNALTKKDRLKEIQKLEHAAKTALAHGLIVNAGHGLNYINVKDILHLPGLYELNIGHSIVSRAVFTGLQRAVEDMLELL